MVKIALLGTFVAYALSRVIHGDHIEEQREDSCAGENAQSIAKFLTPKLEILQENNVGEIYEGNNSHVQELIEIFEKLSKVNSCVVNRHKGEDMETN